MKEPREMLQNILQDQYAMPSTHEHALKLYNMLRRQNTRRKRCRDRMEILDQRIRDLEAALTSLLAATQHLEPCPGTVEQAQRALESNDENQHTENLL